MAIFFVSSARISFKHRNGSYVLPLQMPPKFLKPSYLVRWRFYNPLMILLPHKIMTTIPAEFIHSLTYSLFLFPYYKYEMSNAVALLDGR